MTEEKKIPTLKVAPEMLSKVNAFISGATICELPAGDSIYQVLFRVGPKLRLLIAVLSCGPGSPAAVETSLFRRLGDDDDMPDEDNYELVKELTPQRYPLNRLYEIIYEFVVYQVRIEAAEPVTAPVEEIK
jgi:hypothetical protein